MNLRYADRWLPIACALLAAAVVWPTFDAGWYADDAYWANLRGALEAGRATLGDALGPAFGEWLGRNGRIYPVHLLQKYAVFYVFTSLTAYKLLLITLTVASIEAFRRALARYAPVPFSNLCALAAVTLLQQRGYHDSTLAYFGMTQAVVIELSAAAACLAASLRLRSPLYGILGVLAYTIAALTYESAYPLCVLYVLAAYALTRSRRAALRAGLPYVAVGAGLIAASLIARATRPLSPDFAYRFSGDALTVGRTLLIQVAGAFPLTYWSFDPSGLFGRMSVPAFVANTPLNPLLFIAFGGCAWAALVRASTDAVDLRFAAWCGAAIAVLPALPIAIVAKYQGELRPGLAYLPVFIQLFGVAMLLSALALAVLRNTRARAVHVALAACFALTGTVTAAANVRLGRELRGPAIARASLERSLEGGLLHALPDGTTVAFVQHFDWVSARNQDRFDDSTTGLFYAHGRKRLTVAPDGARAGALLDYNASTHTWTVERPAAAFVESPKRTQSESGHLSFP